MAKRKVDMLSLLNDAWNARGVFTSAKRRESFTIALSRSYIIMKNWYDYKCIKENIKNEQAIFKILRSIIIKLILCDLNLHQEEYEAYCAFVKYCGFKPETIEECKKIYKTTSLKYLKGCIIYVLKFRPIIPADFWEQFLLALCYLCLADGVMYEDQYYILSSFFEKDFDTKPETWEDYKKEHKKLYSRKRS